MQALCRRSSHQFHWEACYRQGTTLSGSAVWGMLQNWTEDLGCQVQGYGAEIRCPRYSAACPGTGSGVGGGIVILWGVCGPATNLPQGGSVPDWPNQGMNFCHKATVWQTHRSQVHSLKIVLHTSDMSHRWLCLCGRDYCSCRGLSWSEWSCHDYHGCPQVDETSQPPYGSKSPFPGLMAASFLTKIIQISPDSPLRRKDLQHLELDYELFASRS